MQSYWRLICEEGAEVKEGERGYIDHDRPGGAFKDFGHQLWAVAGCLKGFSQSGVKGRNAFNMGPE